MCTINRGGATRKRLQSASRWHFQRLGGWISRICGWKYSRRAYQHCDLSWDGLRGTGYYRWWGSLLQRRGTCRGETCNSVRASICHDRGKYPGTRESGTCTAIQVTPQHVPTLSIWCSQVRDDKLDNTAPSTGTSSIKYGHLDTGMGKIITV